MSCSSCTDSNLIAISVIFLFETLYLDAAARGVSDLWTTDITYLRISSWIMVTRIGSGILDSLRDRGWWGFMMKTLKKVLDVLVGGDFNDENLLKGMRSVPVIIYIG